VIHIVWEFRVRPGKEGEFEALYGASGAWVELFRRSPAYQGTQLARDTYAPGRYLLTDIWTDAGGFQRLREEHAGDYEALDRIGEAMTEAEVRLGTFEVC
jgi:quinol monooxygenase YgiN